MKYPAVSQNRLNQVFRGGCRSASLLAVVLGLAISAPAHADPPVAEGAPNSLSGGRGAMPSGIRPDVNPQDELIQQVRLDQKLDAQVPLGLPFMDDAGRQVKLGDYFGEKPVMLIPIQYRCTMLCNEELNALSRSLKEMNFSIGDQFTLLALSIDPRETSAIAAEKKQTYIKEYGRPGAAEGWRFLTGTEPNIKALTDSIGFHFAYDAKTDQYAHPDGVMILTPQGRVARYFFRLEYPAKDLRYGIIEASQNRIGTPLDYLALLCFHYNPTTGTYSVAIMKVVRLAAVATVLLIALAIVVMNRRGPKRETAEETDRPRTVEAEPLEPVAR